MLIDCVRMSEYRKSCCLGRFIYVYRKMQPQISSAKLYALYLNDSVCTDLKDRILSLYHMKLGWHTLLGIAL